jgi:phage FluMu protein Com
MRVIKCDFCGEITEYNQVSGDYRYYEVCPKCKSNFDKAQDEISKLSKKLHDKLKKGSLKIREKYGVSKTIDEGVTNDN